MKKCRVFSFWEALGVFSLRRLLSPFSRRVTFFARGHPAPFNLWTTHFFVRGLYSV
jgi:hypothetical protein